MASGKFSTMNANENMQDSWEALADYLNSLSTDGKKKDVRSWKNVSKYNTNEYFIYKL